MIARLAHLHMKVFVIHSDVSYTYSVHEPGSLDPLILREIAFFRVKLYEQNCPYLLSPTQAQIENKLALDERSYHVLARKKSTGELVGCLRLTPYIFELSELCDVLDWRDFQHKVEIGRLVTDPSVKNVGKKLMMLAGIYIVENTDFKGFVGVCKSEKIDYFKKFGMKVISEEISLKGRPHKYLIITSNFRAMRKNVMINFASRLAKLPFKSKEKNESLS